MMWLLLSACWLMAGCSVIDDDLSDCNQGEEFKIDYQLRLITNITTELETQLTTITEVGVADALRVHLKDIFSDKAHDIDLSFYDTEGDMIRLQHKRDIIDANQTSYTLTLPMQEYMHLAVANIAENHVVGLTNDEHCPTSKLHQTDPTVSSGSTTGVIDSHTTGLFTARLPMNVLEGVNQQFKVNLYMVNCAAALVIDPRKQDVSNIRVYSTGFASQFIINDSTYTFAAPSPIVRTTELLDVNSGMRCYCSVNFPSREPYYNGVGSRSVIETEDPFIAQPGQETLWQFEVYVWKDGKITKTVLSINKPLRAGQLTIIKGWITGEGAVQTSDQTVGVSVTLDWNEGGIYNPEL